MGINLFHVGKILLNLENILSLTLRSIFSELASASKSRITILFLLAFNVKAISSVSSGRSNLEEIKS